MAAASGIVPSKDLLDTWANALGPDSPARIIKIVIDQETLISAAQVDAQGSDEQDFELLGPLGEDESPCFLLYRNRTPESWLFISYVPDASPVRSKMLYASSRQSFVRALGDSRFSSSIFASTKDELTFAAYRNHLKAQQSSAPLTAREQEIADIKAAEAKERREGDTSENANQPRSMLDLSGSTEGTSADGKKAGTGWSDEAAELIKTFAAGDKEIVELRIEEERIIPSPEQPSSLALPKDAPCFTFYKHSAGTVFIYSCPSTSPIKSRMIYASSFHSVRTKASNLGVDVSKRLETSSPEEITDAFVAAEFGQAVAGESTPTGDGGGDKPAFARPSRPGRKR
ncbi:BZ3500_MvSof-1268-A1-R1_Chr9g10693 [Microbotryum saponariae]|uniref:BZ3500_MvSof-1268-A1-R1_Chr9g10693 protein n=1 Tax=Microbotryum saponariae TaxID=289078 RepID=A0A2X0KES1_9BASI|nr:BZ3501_MvSof-1269-A2-R1_Chr9g10441 [Microbotryum saponariae]SDA00534.1 BZ3500_MvSof-1268-A1-R1_Chr9g10693 [Microbotryum saponariae]